MKHANDLILFQTQDEQVKIPVSINQESVLINRQQMAVLFDRDIKTIGKHINNAIAEELEGLSAVAKFATVQIEGDRSVKRDVTFYNLDVIISVGYRVKSQRGVEFRRWANTVLRDYIIRGYALNDNRLDQLGKIVKLMKRTGEQLDALQVLDVVERYAGAFRLLDDYDHQCVSKPAGRKAIYRLNHEDCCSLIRKMGEQVESDLFGREKDESFRSSISVIDQCFSDQAMYPSLEEKAANLLYFIVKNHSFCDGNKRIAAMLFLYFLDRNNALLVSGRKVVDDHTLVAMTILIAESRPDEKSIMVNLVMQMISDHAMS